MFSGDIRRNLDPFNQHGDAALWEVLDSVSLKATVEGMEGGLEVPAWCLGVGWGGGREG